MTDFLLIEEYIQKTKDERQAHLRLDEACIEIGGGSRDFRGLLAHHLGTIIPAQATRVLLAHACHNGKCSNVKHLYWGTYQENALDSYQTDRAFGGFASAGSEQCATWGSKGGKANKGRKFTEEHRQNLAAAQRKRYASG